MKKQKSTVSDCELPKWAIKEIRSLSKRTGISFAKLRDAVLGFGIYNAKEQFGPTANLVESAIAMAKFTEGESKEDGEEDGVEPVKGPIESEENHQEAWHDERIQSPPQEIEPGSTPAENSGLPLDGYVRSNPSKAGLDLVGERRAEPEEIGPDSEFVASLSGE